MLELLGLVALLVVGAVVFGLVALVIGVLKLAFKIALIPLWLGLVALKGLVVLLLVVVGVAVLGPVVLGIGIVVLVPVLLLLGLVWLGKTVATTI